MAKRRMLPEQRFLREVFPHEWSEQFLQCRLGPRADLWLAPLRQHIEAALDRLPYRERGILEMRCGLGDGFAYSLSQIATVFRLPPERICRLRSRALRELRRHADELRKFVGELRL